MIGGDDDEWVGPLENSNERNTVHTWSTALMHRILIYFFFVGLWHRIVILTTTLKIITFKYFCVILIKK